MWSTLLHMRWTCAEHVPPGFKPEGAVHFHTLSGRLTVTPATPEQPTPQQLLRMSLPLAEPSAQLPPPFSQQDAFDLARQTSGAQALVRAAVGDLKVEGGDGGDCCCMLLLASCCAT